MSQTYLLAGRASELERLQLQSRVWEPSGRRLLEEIGDGTGLRVLDVGCGPMGWLPLLSRWVGPRGEVVGTDVDETMLAAADQLITAERLANVRLFKDDVFATVLPQASFDLVHARFMIAPLGRGAEQLDLYLRLLRPGGVVVLEDPDVASWHYCPPARALEQLIATSEQVFGRHGNINAGCEHPALFRQRGIEPRVRAEVLALPPRHPYLRLPLDFSVSLEPKLRALVGDGELQRVRREAEAELDDQRWGLTFTLIQCWGRKPE